MAVVEMSNTESRKSPVFKHGTFPGINIVSHISYEFEIFS